jgi:hypothetical protein
LNKPPPDFTISIGVGEEDPVALYHQAALLKLQPKQSEFIDSDFVYASYNIPSERFQIPSFFARSGIYHLFYLYYGSAPTRQPVREYVTGRVTFEVRKPEGDEAKAHDLLANNDALVRLLLAPEIDSEALPDAETVKAAYSLLKRYPNTSYADYARWSLALLALSGSDKIDKSTAEQKAVARILLGDINTRTFAYAPRALVLMRQIAEDEKGRKQAEELLDKDYPNDLVWLRVKDAGLVTAEMVKQMTDYHLGKTKEPLIRRPRGVQP